MPGCFLVYSGPGAKQPLSSWHIVFVEPHKSPTHVQPPPGHTPKTAIHRQTAWTDPGPATDRPGDAGLPPDPCFDSAPDVRVEQWGRSASQGEQMDRAAGRIVAVQELALHWLLLAGSTGQARWRAGAWVHQARELAIENWLVSWQRAMASRQVRCRASVLIVPHSDTVLSG
jgi:hypothetical protein